MVRQNKFWVLLVIFLVFGWGNSGNAESIDSRLDFEGQYLSPTAVEFNSAVDLEVLFRRSIDQNFGLVSPQKTIANPARSVDVSANQPDDAYWQYYQDCDRWDVVFYDANQFAPKNALPADVCSISADVSQSDFSLAPPIRRLVKLVNLVQCQTQRIRQWGTSYVGKISLALQKQIEMAEFRRVESVLLEQEKRIDWNSAKRLLDVAERRCDFEMAFANQIGWLGKSMDLFSQQLNQRIRRRRSQIHSEIMELDHSRIAERQDDSKIN